MFRYLIIFMLLSVGLSNGAVTWTGASDTNIFNGANYNGLADGLELGPNVTISDDVTFQNRIDRGPLDSLL